jgi:hypothetical protein
MLVYLLDIRGNQLRNNHSCISGLLVLILWLGLTDQSIRHVHPTYQGPLVAHNLDLARGELGDIYPSQAPEAQANFENNWLKIHIMKIFFCSKSTPVMWPAKLPFFNVYFF